MPLFKNCHPDPGQIRSHDHTIPSGHDTTRPRSPGKYCYVIIWNLLYWDIKQVSIKNSKHWYTWIF
jgi:hypothetical protein